MAAPLTVRVKLPNGAVEFLTWKAETIANLKENISSRHTVKSNWYLYVMNKIIGKIKKN